MLNSFRALSLQNAPQKASSEHHMLSRLYALCLRDGARDGPCCQLVFTTPEREQILMTAHSGLDRLYISAQQPSPEMPWRWAASRPAASTPTSKYVAYRVAAHLGQWIRGWQSQVFVDKRFPKSGVMEYHDDPLSDRQILELIERVGERIGERVGRVALEKP